MTSRIQRVLKDQRLVALDCVQPGEKRHPLFVVDFTRLPNPAVDDPMAETKCRDYAIIVENLAHGFNSSVTESYNTECERKAMGMEAAGHAWRKGIGLLHRGPGHCGDEGCPDCDEVLLHACSEEFCPDIFYMFKHGIGPTRMYLDPAHRMNSHILPDD